MRANVSSKSSRTTLVKITIISRSSSTLIELQNIDTTILNLLEPFFLNFRETIPGYHRLFTLNKSSNGRVRGRQFILLYRSEISYHERSGQLIKHTCTVTYHFHYVAADYGPSTPSLFIYRDINIRY